LVAKSEEKRTLGGLKRRWESNIKMDLRETGLEDVNIVHLPQDRVQWRAPVKTAIKLLLPHKAENFLTSCASVSYLRRAAV
jgi:hypothetical protein